MYCHVVVVVVVVVVVDPVRIMMMMMMMMMMMIILLPPSSSSYMYRCYSHHSDYLFFSGQFFEVSGSLAPQCGPFRWQLRGDGKHMGCHGRFGENTRKYGVFMGISCFVGL